LPMARFEVMQRGGHGKIFAHLPAGQGQARRDLLAADGVSCTVCHQILDEGLGAEASFTGGFAVDTAQPAGQRAVYGPFEVDNGRARTMRSSSGAFLAEFAELTTQADVTRFADVEAGVGDNASTGGDDASIVGDDAGPTDSGIAGDDGGNGSGGCGCGGGAPGQILLALFTLLACRRSHRPFCNR